MAISDFPCDVPALTAGRLRNFAVSKIPPQYPEGLCEACGKVDAEMTFAIGNVSHRLCEKCFREMLDSFYRFMADVIEHRYAEPVSKMYEVVGRNNFMWCRSYGFDDMVRKMVDDKRSCGDREVRVEEVSYNRLGEVVSRRTVY